MTTAVSGSTLQYRPRRITLHDQRMVTLRAIVASDAAEILQAFERLSVDSRYMRFMQHKKRVDPATLARGVNPLAGQEFAFVATVPAADGIDIVGAARYLRAAPGEGKGTTGSTRAGDACEFAITVAENWRGSGLATELLASLIRRARRDGYRTMEGLVLAENGPMLALARRMKFAVESQPHDGTVVRVVRLLQPPRPRRPPQVRGARARPAATAPRRRH